MAPQHVCLDDLKKCPKGEALVVDLHIEKCRDWESQIVPDVRVPSSLPLDGLPHNNTGNPVVSTGALGGVGVRKA